VAVEAIGIITILVKVLISIVIDGVIPEEEDFPIIEVKVFAVSYSSEKKSIYRYKIFIGRGGGSGGDSFRDSDDRGIFQLNKRNFFNYLFFFFKVDHIVVIKVLHIVAVIVMVHIAVLVTAIVVHQIIHHIKQKS
jgi:hypothetical protein